MKCITFDITNTLIRVSGSVGYQYSKILQNKFNYNLDEKLTNAHFKKYFLDQNKKYPGFGYRSGISSRTWWCEIVKKIIKENSQQTNQKLLNENELNQISNLVFDEFSKGLYWTKYDNTDLVLSDLITHGYKLGLISNFDERLPLIIKDLNLIKYFDFICIPSRANGYAKPNKEIFSKAFELSGAKTHSDLLHVGDDYDLDYKPAIQYGFKSLIINHSRKEMNGLIKNDQCVFNLIELKNKILQIH